MMEPVATMRPPPIPAGEQSARLGNHELMFWAGLSKVHGGDLDGVAGSPCAIELQPTWRELLRRLPWTPASAAAVLARLGDDWASSRRAFRSAAWPARERSGALEAKPRARERLLVSCRSHGRCAIVSTTAGGEWRTASARRIADFVDGSRMSEQHDVRWCPPRRRAPRRQPPGHHPSSPFDDHPRATARNSGWSSTISVVRSHRRSYDATRRLASIFSLPACAEELT